MAGLWSLPTAEAGWKLLLFFEPVGTYDLNFISKYSDKQLIIKVSASE